MWSPIRLCWPPLCPGKHPCSEIWKDLCRDDHNPGWCHHSSGADGDPLSRKGQATTWAEHVFRLLLWRQAGACHNGAISTSTGTAGMGQGQHRDLPWPCQGCLPRAQPAPEEHMGAGWDPPLCLHLLPVFTLAAEAGNSIPFCYFVEMLWGDGHLNLLTALKETI